MQSTTGWYRHYWWEMMFVQLSTTVGAQSFGLPRNTKTLQFSIGALQNMLLCVSICHGYFEDQDKMLNSSRDIWISYPLQSAIGLWSRTVGVAFPPSSRFLSPAWVFSSSVHPCSSRVFGRFDHIWFPTKLSGWFTSFQLLQSHLVVSWVIGVARVPSSISNDGIFPQKKQPAIGLPPWLWKPRSLDN